MAVGMVLSTLGLIVAMLVGMIMVNFGIRKGWGTYVKEPKKQPDYFYGGVFRRKNVWLPAKPSPPASASTIWPYR